MKTMTTSFLFRMILVPLAITLGGCYTRLACFSDDSAASADQPVVENPAPDNPIIYPYPIFVPIEPVAAPIISTAPASQTSQLQAPAAIPVRTTGEQRQQTSSAGQQASSGARASGTSSRTR